MFTGPALRWEALGLLFTWAALALLNSPADDSLTAKLIAAHETNKAGSISAMVHCSNLCITLCKEYAPASEVLLWLLHESLTLTLQFYGDCTIIVALKASLHFHEKLIVLGHQAWQRLSDLATEVLDPTIVKLGPRIPFIFAQTRRKIIASAYWIDKSLASLHGQVPRITCLPPGFETPLDIDDDELLLKGFDLLHSHSSAWNQSEYTCPATYIRARYILGTFRDELFQLSLIVSTANRLPKLDGENELKDHLPSPLELIRNISALVSFLNQEYHADDQLKLSYINTYRSLECALNDILNSRLMYTLGFGSGTSSSTISPGSEISEGNNNIESELIDRTDDLKWARRSNVYV
ncbi:hypothetical protein BDV33DRAFT_232485 [Aspergillus novoparasiticus]|uniref:Transcription factor domain-containing protein n=1 Tax=Aspergillus novoparasiticus TaxID=986946 RepID=A0A5N6ENK8_9EURO|nr:hypothetical protein BDV33DRAFT_232485 [Aspergillus novoparasiticus]